MLNIDLFTGPPVFSVGFRHLLSDARNLFTLLASRGTEGELRKASTSLLEDVGNPL
jgi:hypothetical protein